MARAFQRGGKWYARYRGVDGWKKKVIGRDRAEAERMAGALEVKAKWRREGLVDPRTDALAAWEKQPLADHLADFKADILARRGNESYATQTHQRAERLLAGVELLSGITPSGVNATVQTLRDDEELSKSSISHHLRAVKMFTRWLIRNGRTRDDALISVRVGGSIAKSERVHVRRALSAEEFQRLIAHTDKAPEAHGMAGADRAMLYRLAGATGFRQGELRTLTPESFDLKADDPGITVRAAYSKRKRDDRQPITPDLVAVLVPWLAAKPRGKAVFAMPHRTKVADMLRADAGAAREVWIGDVAGKAQEDRQKTTFLADTDASGSTLDFHGLRVSYISWLVESGASVKTCQELARHSTPVLTIGCYARMSLHDQGKALAGLPGAGLTPPASEPMTMKATGTYDASSIRGTQVGQTPGDSRRLQITQDESQAAGADTPKGPYSLGQTHEMPMPIGNARSGSRTRTTLRSQDFKS